MKKRTRLMLFGVAVTILLIAMRWANSYAHPQRGLGVVNGRLADCPDSPNCISTQDGGSEHCIAPIPFSQSVEETQRQLEAIIRSMPRSRLISSRNGYVHGEFSSLLFGFVDDVELVIDETEQLVHFRSASRTGRSDLGVNRKRMEQIRQRFQTR